MLFLLWWIGFAALTSNVFSYIVPEAMHAYIAIAKTPAPVTSPFTYHFAEDGSLPEASAMDLTWSPYWWVNSGGYLHLRNGVGQTQQGALRRLDPWRVLYGASNPIDTNGGYHPQNIFRLVSRTTWENVRLEAQFKITNDNWSSSPNQNASNGLLLMSRYKDGNTLYYAGVRVDGNAVIKKKYRGTYYTLAQKKIFVGTYSEDTNLLPHQTWIRLRSDTKTNTDGSVTIKLYMQNGDGSWKLLLEARDNGSQGPTITGSGFIGLRTDFMDVEFDTIRVEKI